MSSINTAGLLITALAVVCLILFLKGLQNALLRTTISHAQQEKIFILTAAALLIWMTLLGILANLQLLATPGLPPKPMFTVIFGLLVIYLFSFTENGKQLLRATPLHWLVFFQAFRIGVELWFWYAYQVNVLPKIMTFEGANFDIIAGVLALVAGMLMLKDTRRSRIVAYVFNIAGILILLNTLRAAALSMPSSIQRYPFDERLLLLGQPFFIYLPGVLVVMALGLHILSLRQLVLQKKP